MTKTADKLSWALILALALFLTGCNSREIIAEGLSQPDANIVLVTLREHEIEAQKVSVANRKNTTYNIAVDKKQAKDALRILVYEQLPKSYRPGLREVYPPGSAGLIPTKSDEQARLIMAQEGELEALLKILPNVVDARVVLSIDQNIDIGRAPSTKSAAVTMTYKPNPEDDDAPLSAPQIANLISSAVGSLALEQVMVVIKPIRPIPKEKAADKIANPLPAPPPKNASSPVLLWTLLALTFVALILAAYAFLRSSWFNARGQEQGV